MTRVASLIVTAAPDSGVCTQRTYGDRAAKVSRPSLRGLESTTINLNFFVAAARNKT